MKPNNSLYILSNGRVAAINKKDGQIIWEIKLKQHLGGAASLSIGQISVEADRIIVGISGMLLCLSTKDGSLVWKNELKGWGFQFVSMANVDNEAATAASMAASSASTAVITAS